MIKTQFNVKETTHMPQIVSLKQYKRAHDIPLVRSPYYTLNATKQEVYDAYQRAIAYLSLPVGKYSTPQIVLFGYEHQKTRKIKLLKNVVIYSDEETFRLDAGKRGYDCLMVKSK